MDTKDIRIKAVAAGLATDIGGSVVGAIVLAILVIVLNGGETSPEHLATLKDNIYVNLFGVLVSTFFTGLGGYVAARLSRPDGLINAITVGILSVLLGIVLMVLVPGVTPDWHLLLGAILAIPAALLGGKIATRASL